MNIEEVVDVLLEGEKIDRRLRQQVNKALAKFLKNQFWSSYKDGLNQLNFKVLDQFDLAWGNHYGGLPSKESGSLNIPLLMGGEEVANSMLRIQWAQSGDNGRYELLAYVT